MIGFRVKKFCDGCLKLSPVPDTLMEYILQSSCHQAAIKAVCKAARKAAGNLQSQFNSKPARPVQIAHCPPDLSQSAWFFMGDRLNFGRKFLSQIFSRCQAAAIILEVFRLDSFSIIRRSRHRYVYCWLTLVRN
jgi:hypothetical protein